MLCARFCVDSPYALAIGGTKNGFQTIDIRGLQSGIICYAVSLVQSILWLHT